MSQNTQPKPKIQTPFSWIFCDMGVLGPMFPAFVECDFESECDSESESCSGDTKVIS